MPRPSASRVFLPTILVLAVVGVAYRQVLLADDTVSARGGGVGSTADGVQKSSGADLLRPNKVESVGDGKTKVGTTLLHPPQGYKFKPFDSKAYNEPSLWFNVFPPSLSDGMVEALQGDESNIQFARTFDTPPTTADTFAFGGEGNLTNGAPAAGPGPGAGAPPPQAHWAVKEKPVDYLRWVLWKSEVGSGQTNPEVIWQIHELPPQITLQSHQAGATVASGAQLKGRVRSFTEIPGKVIVNGQEVSTTIESDDTTANAANEKTGPFYAHFQATLSGSDENTACVNVSYAAKTALTGYLSVPVAWDKDRENGTLLAFQRSTTYQTDADARSAQEERLYAIDVRVSGTAGNPSSPAPSSFYTSEYQSELEKKSGDFFRQKRGVVFVAHWDQSTADTNPNNNTTHAISEGLEIVPMPETTSPRLRATAPGNLGNVGDKRLMHDELYALNMNTQRPDGKRLLRAFKADAWDKSGGTATENSAGNCLALPFLDPTAINAATGTDAAQVMGTIIYTPVNNVYVSNEDPAHPDLTAIMKPNMRVTITDETGTFATHFKLLDDSNQEVSLPITLLGTDTQNEKKWKVAARTATLTLGQARALPQVPVLRATLRMPLQDGKNATQTQAYAVDRLKFVVRDEEKDTDRDDLVEVAADLDSFGSDSGTIAFDPHPARSPAGATWPQVFLPLVSTQWDQLNIHAYFMDGASHLRPNRWWKSPNNNAFWGVWQNYSLHTRVFHPMDPSLSGSAQYNFTDKKRIVTVVRPGGNEVSFVFDDQAHAAVGIPIGANKRRGYVLIDRTPSDTNDLNYELHFPSGVIHRFETAPAVTSASGSDYTPDDGTRYGVLTVVRDASGRQVNLPSTAVLGWSPLAGQSMASSGTAAQTPLTFNTTDVAGPKYQSIKLGWNGGAVGVAKYKDRTSPAEIKVAGLVNPNETARPFRWVALEKTGTATGDLAELSCRVENATITHGEKDAPADQLITVARSGGTLTTTLPGIAQGAGSLTAAPTTGTATVTAAYAYNIDDLLTSVTSSASGVSGQSVTKFTYGTGTGRCTDNRAPQWAQVARTEATDGTNLFSWTEYPAYDPKAGWPTRVLSSYKGTAAGSGREDTLTYALGAAGVAGEDPVSPASNNQVPYLVESPRKTITKLAGALVGTRYLQIDKTATGATYISETAKTAGAAFGSSLGLRSVTTLKALGPADISSPQAGGVTYTSSLTSGGAALKVTANATGPGGDKTTDQEAQVNAFGIVESSKTTLYADGGFEPVDQLTTQPWTEFGFGRIKKATPLIATSYTEVKDPASPSLRGPGRVRNSDGSETTFIYDRLGRVTSSTHYPGGDQSRSLASQSFYDALGRSVWTNTVGTNPGNTVAGEVSSVTALSSQDFVGRLLSSTDNNGNTTSFAYTFAGGAWTATTTLPQGNTSAVTTFIDGRTKSTSGTAEVAMAYTYAPVASQGETVSVAYAGLTGDYTKSYANFFGAVFKTERPGPTSSLLTEQTTFDDLGRPTQVTGMDGILTQITYNGRGEVADSTTGGRKVALERSFGTPTGMTGAPKCYGVKTTVGQGSAGSYAVQSFTGVAEHFGGSQFTGGSAVTSGAWSSFLPDGSGGGAVTAKTSARSASDSLILLKGTPASATSGVTGASATFAQSPLLIDNQTIAQYGSRQFTSSLLHDKVGLPKKSTFPDGRTFSIDGRDKNDNALAWTREDGQPASRTLNAREQTTLVQGAGVINHGTTDVAANAKPRGIQSGLNSPAANADYAATSGVATQVDYLPAIALPAKKTIDGQVAATFEYQANAWPKAVTRADSREEFTFDPANGDLLKQAYSANGGNGAAFSYQFTRDALGRLTGVTGDGIASGQGQTYTWTDGQSVSQVQFGHANATVAYTYDGEGRRTGVTVTGNGWSLGNTQTYDGITGLLGGFNAGAEGSVTVAYEPGLGAPNQITTTLGGTSLTQDWTPEAQTNRTKTLATTAGGDILHAVSGVGGAGMWNAVDQRQRVEETRLFANMDQPEIVRRESFYDGDTVAFAEAAPAAPVLAIGRPFAYASFTDDFEVATAAGSNLNPRWTGIVHEDLAGQTPGTVSFETTNHRGHLSLQAGVPTRVLQYVGTLKDPVHDAEITATLAVANAGDSMGVALRAQWDPAAAQSFVATYEDMVEASITPGTKLLTVRASQGQIGTANLPTIVAPGESWRVKMRVTTAADGTPTLRVKAWKPTNAEPAAWSATLAGPNIPRAAGRVGITARTLAVGDFYVDDAQVTVLDDAIADDCVGKNNAIAFTPVRGWSTAVLNGGKTENAFASTLQGDRGQVALTAQAPLTAASFVSPEAYAAWVAQGARSGWFLTRTRRNVAAPDAVTTVTVVAGSTNTGGLISHYAAVSPVPAGAMNGERYYHAFPALDGANPIVKIEKVVGGSVVQTWQASAAFVAGDRVTVRFKGGANGLLQAKAWTASTAEPAWQIDQTDANTPLAAGRCGLAVMSGRNGAGQPAGGQLTVDAYTLMGVRDLPVLPTTSLWVSAQVVSPKRTDVNWTDAVNEAGYQVDYSTDGGTTWQSLAHAGQNVTQASDLSVVASQNRLYRVIALDANNQPLMVNTTVVRGQSATVTTPALPAAKSPSKDRLSFERVANADGATRSGECRSLNFDQIGNLRSVWQAGQTTTCNSNRLNQLTSRSGSKSIVVEGHANADQHLLVRLALEDGTGSTWVPAARDGDHFCAVLANPNAYAQQVRVEIGEAGFNVQGGAEITTIETRFVQVRPKAENFIYDLRGNLQQDGTRNYTFDLADRLIQVQTNLQGVDAQTTAQFAYDFMGRRIARTISLGGQPIEQTKFVYDGQLPLAEVDANNQLVRSYAWSPGAQAVGGIGALQSITIYQDPQGVALSSPKRFLVVSDDKGNVIGLVSASTNQVVVSYRYGPYGEVLEKASDGSDEGELALASNKFLWQTKYYEESVEAYDFGYRWLQVATGRWMSRDPLAEEGGLNLYAYCDGDATNGMDPWGLTGEDLEIIGKAGVRRIGDAFGMRRPHVGNIPSDAIEYDRRHMTDAQFFSGLERNNRRAIYRALGVTGDELNMVAPPAERVWYPRYTECMDAIRRGQPPLRIYDPVTDAYLWNPEALSPKDGSGRFALSVSNALFSMQPGAQLAGSMRQMNRGEMPVALTDFAIQSAATAAIAPIMAEQNFVMRFAPEAAVNQRLWADAIVRMEASAAAKAEIRASSSVFAKVFEPLPTAGSAPLVGRTFGQGSIAAFPEPFGMESGQGARLGGAAPVRLGQAGESAITRTTGLPKNTESFIVNERTRIPDFIPMRDAASNPLHIIESKNTAYQSLSRQLLDYKDLVGQGGRVDVALPPWARVSRPLQKAFSDPDNPLFRMDLPK